MAKTLTVTIADSVYADIENFLKARNKANRSEWVEEFIRAGMPIVIKKGGKQ